MDSQVWRTVSPGQVSRRNLLTIMVELLIGQFKFKRKYKRIINTLNTLFSLIHSLILWCEAKVFSSSVVFSHINLIHNALRHLRFTLSFLSRMRIPQEPCKVYERKILLNFTISPNSYSLSAIFKQLTFIKSFQSI